MTHHTTKQEDFAQYHALKAVGAGLLFILLLGLIAYVMHTNPSITLDNQMTAQDKQVKALQAEEALEEEEEVEVLQHSAPFGLHNYSGASKPIYLTEPPMAPFTEKPPHD